jgi:hypothetical protein
MKSGALFVGNIKVTTSVDGVKFVSTRHRIRIERVQSEVQIDPISKTCLGINAHNALGTARQGGNREASRVAEEVEDLKAPTGSLEPSSVFPLIREESW